MNQSKSIDDFLPEKTQSCPAYKRPVSSKLKMALSSRWFSTMYLRSVESLR
jgi:hypothetical protein